MTTDFHRERSRRRTVRHTLVVAFAVAFYVALVPLAVVLSGPIYEALRCSFIECREAGSELVFVLPTRGSLHPGSTIRLPNGERVGEVLAFEATGDERYTRVRGLLFSDAEHLREGPLFCQASANFTLEMDADLVVSQCPGLDLGDAGTALDRTFVCGTVDHFDAMGQALREFVLENVRPGEGLVPPRLTGPCGADNAEASAQLRLLLAGAP